MVVVTLPCWAQEINQTREEEKLMALSTEWAEVTKRGDVDQIVSYWSEDAILMTPDQGKIAGWEQLRAMVQASLGIPGFEIGWEPKMSRVAASGDLGYIIAHKYVKIPDESGDLKTFHFIEVGIWEKQKNGTWKNTIDIYNPDPSISSIDD